MMRRVCALGAIVAACAVAASASGQVLESFEHGNEALWAQQTPGDNLSLASSGGRACGLGAEFSDAPLAGGEGWRTRFDLATSPGNRYAAFVRFRGPAPTGRIHLGVGATSGGTWSAVIAADAGSLILQNNAAYGAVDVATVPFTPVAGTWYVIALDWQRNGDMTARVYNDTMGALLAQTPVAATGLTTVGGLAIRGLGGSGGMADLDEIARTVILESFEHSNEAIWAQQTPGDNMTLTSAAAHLEGRGAEFGVGPGGFRTRFDLVTQPGRRYSALVRAAGAGAPAARVSLGVGASAGGAWSAVFAPDTNQILLENNTGYGSATVQSAAFTAATNTWYQLEIDWRINGDMVARLYDESGKAVLARTSVAATGLVTPGGIAIRGVGAASVVGQLDDITQAPVLEDFEHGLETLYAQQTAGDNMAVTARSARSGSFGAEFATGPIGWRSRFDLPTSPGHQYRAFVRAAGPPAGAGRVYMAVGATPAGAFSAVFAPNTGEILLQNNTGYGFIDAATVPFNAAANTWYVLALEWRRSGHMRVKVYDEPGGNLLAQTPLVATNYTAAGGLALRGFAIDPGNFQDIDDLTFTTHAPCYADCNADGVLTVADFGCFQTRFVQASCYADCNGDGVRTVSDFGCFQTRFVVGCP